MKLNFHEWWRKPLSTLEKTLRLPRIIQNGLVIGIYRLIIPSLIVGYLFKVLFFDSSLVFPMSLLLIVIKELFLLRSWLHQKILPRHTQNLAKIGEKYLKRKNLTNRELVYAIEDAVDKSAWSITHVGYVGLAAYGWEIIFRFLYPLITKKKNTYQSLLVGFSNKNTESDQALWEVAQEVDTERRKKHLLRFFETYGSRIDDVDLQYPTLREQSELVKSLLILYKKSPSPKSRLESAIKRRQQAYSYVLEDLRIPKPIFGKLLQLVQGNVRLREDRRFHEFEFDFYIRQLLFELADREKLPRTEIFSYTWHGLKQSKNVLEKLE